MLKGKDYILFLILTLFTKYIHSQSSYQKLILCPNESTTLQPPTNTDNLISFKWTGPQMVDTLNLNLNLTTPQKGIYILTRKYEGENLIKNHKFDDGIRDFETDYFLNTHIGCTPEYPFCESTINVISDVSSIHKLLFDCEDPVEKNGKFLVYNGSKDMVDIWCQNILFENLQSEYRLSFLATSLYDLAPPKLKVAIDGVQDSKTLALSDSFCIWKKYELVFSPMKTQETICIFDIVTDRDGNDGAIDEIYLTEVKYVSDTFEIDVWDAAINLSKSGDLTCENKNIEIVAKSDNEDVTFLWKTNSGIISQSDDKSKVIVNSPGEYFLEISDFTLSCKKSKSIVVNSSGTSNIIYPNILDRGAKMEQNRWFTLFYNISCPAPKIKLLNIFDRYGNIVFAKEDFITESGEKIWNLHFHNRYVEQGTYVVLIEFDDPSIDYLISNLLIL